MAGVSPMAAASARLEDECFPSQEHIMFSMKDLSPSITDMITAVLLSAVSALLVGRFISKKLA